MRTHGHGAMIFVARILPDGEVSEIVSVDIETLRKASAGIFRRIQRSITREACSQPGSEGRDESGRR